MSYERCNAKAHLAAFGSMGKIAIATVYIAEWSGLQDKQFNLVGHTWTWASIGTILHGIPRLGQQEQNALIALSLAPVVELREVNSRGLEKQPALGTGMA